MEGYGNRLFAWLASLDFRTDVLTYDFFAFPCFEWHVSLSPDILLDKNVGNRMGLLARQVIISMAVVGDCSQKR